MLSKLEEDMKEYNYCLQVNKLVSYMTSIVYLLTIVSIMW